MIRMTLALAAVLAITAAVAQSHTTTTKTVHPAPKATGQATRIYSGTSDKGEFEEALEAAIRSSLEARKNVSDVMVDWKLKEVSGTQGGIGGFHKLTVTIEVKPR